jgi:hypothetical protein
MVEDASVVDPEETIELTGVDEAAAIVTLHIEQLAAPGAVQLERFRFELRIQRGHRMRNRTPAPG